MLTDDDIRRLGKIRADSDAARKLFKEYAHLFKPLLKLMKGHVDHPLGSFDDIDWLLTLVERETGLNTRKPEETIEWLKVMRRKKKS